MAAILLNPQPIQCMPDNIPQELKQLNQWVIWGVSEDIQRKQFEEWQNRLPQEKRKPFTYSLKCPYKPTSTRQAKAGQPGTWGSFYEAANRVKAGQAQGVGFEFSGNGYVGVDLDTVRNPETGEVSAEAQEIISLLDSYTEISPSGYGFHILVKADIALKRNKKKLSAPAIVERLDEKGKSKNPEIEAYNNERYFTITGNIYGERKAIESRTEQLQAVCDKFLTPAPTEQPKPKAAQDTADFQTDDEYLNIGLLKDQKFIELWNGNRPNGNESADDQALLNKLAYWCNGNESLMQGAFFSSPHYSSKDAEHIKKCNRADYIPRTIQKAVTGLRATAQTDNDHYRMERAREDFAQVEDKPAEPKKTGLVKMSDVTPQGIAWLWKPYIPLGKITLMRGDPGQGKTTVSLTLAAIVSNGWAFPSESGFTSADPGNVLYITAEDGLADTIAPRLIKAKANLDRVFSYEETSVDQLSFMHPRFEELIKEAQPKLIIVDPIQGYLGAGVDGHKANEVRPVMRHVGMLAEKYNCAIILIEHMSKNIGTKGLYRGLGSIDTTAAARSVLLVGSNPEDENDKGISQIKSNLAKPGKVIGFSISDERGLEWKKDTTLTTDMILGSLPMSNDDKPDSALEEAKDFLEDVLSEGKQSSKDIHAMAVQYGISKATLKRAKEALNLDCTERTGFGKDTTVYWKLPYDISFVKPEKMSKAEEAQIINLFDKINEKQTPPENELH